MGGLWKVKREEIAEQKDENKEKNIVRVVYVVFWGTAYYLVMKLISHLTMFSIGVIPVSETVRIQDDTRKKR
jgi:hypothetical protein